MLAAGSQRTSLRPRASRLEWEAERGWGWGFIIGDSSGDSSGEQCMGTEKGSLRSRQRGALLHGGRTKPPGQRRPEHHCGGYQRHHLPEPQL